MYINSTTQITVSGDKHITKSSKGLYQEVKIKFAKEESNKDRIDSTAWEWFFKKSFRLKRPNV